MSIYVYRYGLSHPIDNADLVYEQLRAAHRYRNTLVEIERARRAAMRAAIESARPDMPALFASAKTVEANVCEIVAAISKERASTRKRAISSPLKAALAQAREKKKEAVAAVREARAQLRDDPALKAMTALLYERAGELVRGARALCGVYWGTYLLIEDEMQASAKMPLYADDGVSPNDPRFVRWEGDGALGVQIQTGAPAKQVMAGGCTLLRLRPDERAYLDRACDRRRVKAKTGRLDFRVGSDDKGRPIWAAWHLDMHRLLPEGGAVKRAAVHMRRVSRTAAPEWSLTVSVEHTRPVPPPTGKTVAIDVGWRVLPDGRGIRVAGWRDTDGKEGEILLPPKMLARLGRPKELRSERDHHFGLAKMRLSAWLRLAPNIAPWLREAAAHLDRWGSADRLQALYERWAREPSAGDETARGDLQAWYWRDCHLSTCEASMRRSSLRGRECFYAMTGAALATAYDTIVIEQFDLRRVARRASTGDDTSAENETARSNRQLVGVSCLRSAIVRAAAGRGRIVAAMPAQDTTRACPSCGVVEDRPAEESIDLTCATCGATWDQDVRGAPTVLLQRWRERPGDAKILAGAREDEKSSPDAEKKESRYEKRARGMKAKRAVEKGLSQTGS